MTNYIFGAYKNYVVTHVRNSYQTASDMAIATICAYPPSQHIFPHWKYVLCCCYNLPFIDI